jgi:hypothetical protein
MRIIEKFMEFGRQARAEKSMMKLLKSISQPKKAIERNTPVAVQRGNEATNDDPSKIGTGAIKYDAGKPCVWRGLVEYFPRAALAVSDISTFGAQKYAWAGWENVDDGIKRYSDAMMRHIFKEGMGEIEDPDSGLLHAAHAAWGAMARLELILREQKNG